MGMPWFSATTSQAEACIASAKNTQHLIDDLNNRTQKTWDAQLQLRLLILDAWVKRRVYASLYDIAIS